MPCECCKITNDQFGKDIADADLKEYRRKGPAKQTRLMLEAVRSLGLKDASLRAEGLQRVSLNRLFVWEVALYRRA